MMIFYSQINKRIYRSFLIFLFKNLIFLMVQENKLFVVELNN